MIEKKPIAKKSTKEAFKITKKKPVVTKKALPKKPVAKKMSDEAKLDALTKPKPAKKEPTNAEIAADVKKMNVKLDRMEKAILSKA